MFGKTFFVRSPMDTSVGEFSVMQRIHVLPISLKHSSCCVSPTAYLNVFGRTAEGSLSDYVMQEVGLVKNALSSERLGATLVLECSSHKLDRQRFTDKVRRTLMPLSRSCLHSKDLYSVCAGTAVGSHDVTRLRVARGSLTPQEISHLISGEVRVLISEGSFALGPDPYGSKRSKLVLLQLLHRVGFLTWRKKAKCPVGCFFVKKKDSMLRFVVDVRWSNRMCSPPPYSRLVVPSVLAWLSAGEGAEEVHLIEMVRAGYTHVSNPIEGAFLWTPSCWTSTWIFRFGALRRCQARPEPPAARHFVRTGGCRGA